MAPSIRHPRTDRGLVAAFWELESRGGSHRVLPDSCLDFLFDLDSGDAQLVGAMSRAILVTTTPGKRYFGVRFHPGAARRLITVSADELTDQDAALTDVVPNAARLVEQVVKARDAGQRRQVCLEHLSESQARLRPPDPRVELAVGRLVQTGGATRTGELAAEVGLSERHLERLFAQYVGVGPKLFARVMRLQCALRAGRGTQTQAQWAARLGFADESHLLREFQTLAGCTPKQLARAQDVGIVQVAPSLA